MTDKNISNARKVGGDYFKLINDRKSNKKLEDYIHLFNLDDYYIYKRSNTFLEVSKEDLYEFKYSGYILFKKDLYCNQVINDWIDFVRTLYRGSLTYLDKPFPPIEYQKKIRIIQ